MDRPADDSGHLWKNLWKTQSVVDNGLWMEGRRGTRMYPSSAYPADRGDGRLAGPVSVTCQRGHQGDQPTGRDTVRFGGSTVAWRCCPATAAHRVWEAVRAVW